MREVVRTRFYKSVLLQALIIALAGSAIYSNTLHVPFQYDDKFLIDDNPIIKNMDYVLNPEAAADLKDYGLFMRRYVGFATFAVNYSIHGLQYAGYHIFNILLHITNALLLYSFVVLMLRTPLLRGTPLEANSRVLAFIVSLVFVSHPVHTEAVTYIYQRIAALSFTFYISSLCLYSMARSGGGKKRGAVLYLLALLCALAAVKTKENSLTLPMAVALYEIVFFRGSLRRRAFLVVPFLLPVMLYAVTLSHTGLSVSSVLVGHESEASDIVTRSSFDADYLNPSAKRSEYMLTEQRVLTTYLRLLVFPVDQNLDYDYPRYTSVLAPPVFLSAMFHLALLVLGAWCIVLSRHEGRAPLGAVGFGIWFFYVALLVESSIVPLPLVIAEYRAYLPSAGVLVAAATGAALAYESVSLRRKEQYAIAAVALIVVSLCAATYSRNRVWSSSISLWRDVVSKAPQSSRGNFNLGTAYYEAGEYQDAVYYLEEALRIKERTDSQVNKAYNNLSISYIRLGMYDKAIGLLREAISRTPADVSLHYNLASAYKRKGIWQEAVAAYGRALELDPQHYDSLIGLAEAFRARLEPDKAIEQYEKALVIRPGDLVANNNIASVLLREGRTEEALPYLTAASKESPGNSNTRMLLQYYYMKMKKTDQQGTRGPDN